MLKAAALRKKVRLKVNLFKGHIMAKKYDDDDGKLRIFNTTLDEMRANRRATGETFPSKFTKKTLRQSSIDNLQPTTGNRVDFSDEKMGPNFRVSRSKRAPMKEGEYGNVNREGNPEAIGPDMGKVNKEAAKAARDFTATEMAQNLMSPGYNKKKGGTIKAKKMSSGGKVSQLAKANGCAVRGKSKGRIV
jgi:hypothetical protein